MQRGHRGSHLGLLLLATQFIHLGLDNIPPVTLAVLGLNVYLYLFPAAPLIKACVSIEQAYQLKDWRRLLLSPFHHVDDMHLYFNMASFLWKGIRLERRFGGAFFLYLLSVFSLLTGVVYLLLEATLTALTDDYYYSKECAVGFSGVLFGLKVLCNHYYPGDVTYVMGIPVPNRYASWIELVVIHMTSPGTSFCGHLAGILVGLLYTSGPLQSIMKTCAELVNSDFRPRTQYNYSGYSGTTDRSDYSGGLTEEEQLERAIRNSLNERERVLPTAPPPYGFQLSEEEMRERRLRRFNH